MRTKCPPPPHKTQNTQECKKLWIHLHEMKHEKPFLSTDNTSSRYNGKIEIIIAPQWIRVRGGQCLSFGPQTTSPRSVGSARCSLRPSGRRSTQQDSSASSQSSRRPENRDIRACSALNQLARLKLKVSGRDWQVNVPWGRGSSSTPWQRSYSRCLVWSSETRPCRHTPHPPRLLPPSQTVALRSEGWCWGGGSVVSSRMFLSACCRCSPEGSSARGQCSKQPEERPRCRILTCYSHEWSISGLNGNFLL